MTDQPVVLVVDDDTDGRELYATTLRSAGYAVDQASDGHEAVDKAFKRRPALILMDLLLPRLYGWEAIDWLKRNAMTSGIPIVVITGDADRSHIERAKAAGAERVLLKPCAPKKLLAEIEEVLRSSA